MTSTLSQNPLDYYNKQMLSQSQSQTYGLPPLFNDQFSQFNSDLWLQQPESKPFFVSPSTIMPRTASESPTIIPLNLDASTFGSDPLADSMFKSSPVDDPAFMFQQFPPHQQQAGGSPPSANPYDILGSPTFSVTSNKSSHRKTTSSVSSNGSLRSSTSPPPVAASSSSAHRPTRSMTQRGTALLSGRRTTLPPKKTTHNMIEKRYRNNLNDKIAALRDAIPAMRVMVQRLENQVLTGSEVPEDEDEEDLDGLAPANKVNKATILSKATEYIAHLEAKNKALASENTELKNKVSGLEMMVMGGGSGETKWN